MNHECSAQLFSRGFLDVCQIAKDKRAFADLKEIHQHLSERSWEQTGYDGTVGRSWSVSWPGSTRSSQRPSATNSRMAQRTWLELKQKTKRTRQWHNDIIQYNSHYSHNSAFEHVCLYFVVHLSILVGLGPLSAVDDVQSLQSPGEAFVWKAGAEAPGPYKAHMKQWQYMNMKHISYGNGM